MATFNLTVYFKNAKKVKRAIENNHMVVDDVDFIGNDKVKFGFYGRDQEADYLREYLKKNKINSKVI